MMNARIKKYVPLPVKKFLKWIYFWNKMIIKSITGKKGSYIQKCYGDEDPDIVYAVLYKSGKANYYVGLMADIVSFLPWIEFCVKNDLVPVLDRKHFPALGLQDYELIGKVNALDYYFLPPGGVYLDDVEMKKKNVRYFDICDDYNFWYMKNKSEPAYYANRTYKGPIIKKWREYRKLYFRITDSIDNRIKSEYEAKFKNKRVLGVSLREGIQKGIEENNEICIRHAFQPDNDEVIILVKRKMKEWHCDTVFLTCEAIETRKIWRDAFGNDVLIYSERILPSYDDVPTTIEDAIIRKNRIVTEDYLVDVCLLARCVSLIGGRCGASVVAKYFKNGEYENEIIFDKGVFDPKVHNK